MRETRRIQHSVWLVEAIALIHEIVSTGERIAAARDWDGAPALAVDPSTRLLAAIDSSTYWLSISDLARALGIRRQSAHALVREAALCGDVVLHRNPDDRRIVKVRLSANGRKTLAAVRGKETEWVIILLNGLGRREAAATNHVLRVIGQRLERTERGQRLDARRARRA